MHYTNGASMAFDMLVCVSTITFLALLLPKLSAVKVPIGFLVLGSKLIPHRLANKCPNFRGKA